MTVKCDYCDRPAKLVSGTAIYPHRTDLAHKNFWKCDPCDAWVGCHPKRTARQKGRGDGTLPMGRLANAELRKAKQAAHAAFDALWRSGAMRRKQAYAWLAEQIGVSVENCHIGMFDVDGCKAVVAACRPRTTTQGAEQPAKEE